MYASTSIDFFNIALSHPDLDPLRLSRLEVFCMSLSNVVWSFIWNIAMDKVIAQDLLNNDIRYLGILKN